MDHQMHISITVLLTYGEIFFSFHRKNQDCIKSCSNIPTPYINNQAILFLYKMLSHTRPTAFISILSFFIFPHLFSKLEKYTSKRVLYFPFSRKVENFSGWCVYTPIDTVFVPKHKEYEHTNQESSDFKSSIMFRLETLDIE